MQYVSEHMVQTSKGRMTNLSSTYHIRIHSHNIGVEAIKYFFLNVIEGMIVLLIEQNIYET